MSAPAIIIHHLSQPSNGYLLTDPELNSKEVLPVHEGDDKPGESEETVDGAHNAVEGQKRIVDGAEVAFRTSPFHFNCHVEYLIGLHIRLLRLNRTALFVVGQHAC